MTFRELYPTPPVIGTVALLPLPGSLSFKGDFDYVRRRAVADAQLLVDGGCDGVLLSNERDAPFTEDRTHSATVAAYALVAAAVVEAARVPVGVQVFRNDAPAAVGIATCAGALFVRIAGHVGVRLGDHGLMEGRAAETLRLRSTLHSDVALLADVVAGPGGSVTAPDPVRVSHETYYRGLANAIVLTGEVGRAVLRAVREAAPEAPVLVADVTLDTAGAMLALSDGIVFDQAAHRGGDLTLPVNLELVRALVGAAGR